MKYPVFVYLLVGLFMCGSFWGCKKKVEEQPEENVVVDSVAAESEGVKGRDLNPMERKMVGILSGYYRALEAEDVNEEKYFAPKVRKFFGQYDADRGTILKTLEEGFGDVENRFVQLDTNSISVELAGSEYIVIFDGEVSYTRVKDGEEVREPFRNRMVLDSEFKILECEEAPMDRKMDADEERAYMREIRQNCNLALMALDKGRYKVLDKMVHPDKGFYYIIRPGAFDMVHSVQKASKLKEVDELVTERFEKADWDFAFQLKALPSFSCENEFEEEGTYLSGKLDYNRLEKVMRGLNDAGMAKYTEEDLADAKATGEAVLMQLVVTQVPVSLYFGKIDDKWYLLIIDVAEYDCSA